MSTERVCIVGARSFPHNGAPFIWHIIEELDNDAVVLVRSAGWGGPSSVVDAYVRQCAEQRGLTIQLCSPQLPGREGVFHRDNEMVAAADRVVAFYDPEHIGEGGTGHVVEAALRANKPVTAWTVRDGTLVYVGDLDGPDTDPS